MEFEQAWDQFYKQLIEAGKEHSDILPHLKIMMRACYFSGGYAMIKAIRYCEQHEEWGQKTIERLEKEVTEFVHNEELILYAPETNPEKLSEASDDNPKPV